MRGLTLTRPWPWAILGLVEPLAKRIENRPTRPPCNLMGELICIHAGKTYDLDAEYSIRKIAGVWPPEDASCPMGIVGVARITDYVVIGEEWSERRLKELGQAQWFFGPCGWVLTDVRALARPVPCRGMQGFWPVPPEVEAQVRAQLGEQVAP